MDDGAQNRWWWTLLGATAGLLAVGLVYGAHLVAAGTLNPKVLVDLHLRWPAFLLLDTTPVILAWVGLLTGRLRATEHELDSVLAGLGPWADGKLAETMLEGALLVGADGQIVAANPSAHAMLAYPDLVGRSIRSVLPDHARTDPNRATERKSPGTHPRRLGVEWLMNARGADEETFPVRVACAPATRQCIVYVLRPATTGAASERTARPADWGAEKKRLVAQRDQAVESNRAKSAFIAGLSHELRTPMNAILGYVELIADDAADAGLDVAHDVHAIRSSAKHLLGLINKVLDLSKIEAGRMSVVLEPLPIAPLLLEVESYTRSLALKNNNTLTVHAGDDVRIVRGDAMRLRQVLINLVGNACKFTTNGTIALTVRYVSHGTGAGDVQFMVADTGMGMTEAQLDGLFREYVQADTEIKRRFGGTGLGLALSSRFVELMGGTISVTSEFGKGSEFVVHLPTSTTHHTLIPELWEAPTDPVPGMPTTLVIVDDNDTAVRELLRRQLAQHGQKNVVWPTAPDADEIVAFDPRAVVLDFDIDGAAALLDALGGTPGMAGVPVILCAADKPMPFPAGAAVVVDAPLEATELVPALRLAERTASGCLIVGAGADVERVERVLKSEGWRTDVHPALGAADAALATHRCALLVWVESPEQDEDLDEHRALRELPTVWVGEPERAPDGPQRFAVPLVADDEALAQLIALALHHRELPADPSDPD